MPQARAACACSPSVYRKAAITCVGWLWGSTMTLINLGLWLVLAALIAIIPFGCVMTRPGKKKEVPQADKPT